LLCAQGRRRPHLTLVDVEVDVDVDGDGDGDERVEGCQTTKT
jgi:hypothetical protein